MSLWGAVKSLFGSGDNASKVVDSVISTGDALFFTDEEKSAANLKAFELKIRFAEATMGSRLARRYLSLMVTGTYLVWFSIAGVCTLMGKPEMATALGELLTSLAVGGSFVTIISFYFASGMLRDK